MSQKPTTPPQLDEKPMEGVTIRYTLPEDAQAMRQWFEEPGILRWFPCWDPWEIDESVQRWISFSRYRASLTAEMDGKAVGICTLYLQPYRKLVHHCELGIIVSKEMRGKGLGDYLMRSLMKLAKEQFSIEWLSLQVYTDNPAIRLYQRLGFEEYGRQDCWIKELDGSYVGRIYMQRRVE